MEIILKKNSLQEFFERAKVGGLCDFLKIFYKVGRVINWTSYSDCKLTETKDCQQEEFEDTKGAIRIRISKKNRQHNGQKKKYKKTKNDLQNIHIKLKIEWHEPQ